MNPDPLPRPSLSYRLMQAVMWPVMKLFRMSCRSAYELAAERMDRPLKISEKARLGTHRALCGACRRLPFQFEQLRAWVCEAEEHEHEQEGADHPGLPSEARERIDSKLRETRS